MTGLLPMPEHLTEDGDRFLVPEGYIPDEHSARCRSCGALICWVKTPRDKRMPINPDGKSHFATCPQANDWRRRA
jgi:hypothetical protein